jgi:hypothetical protein
MFYYFSEEPPDANPFEISMRTELVSSWISQIFCIEYYFISRKKHKINA